MVGEDEGEGSPDAADEASTVATGAGYMARSPRARGEVAWIGGSGMEGGRCLVARKSA